MQLAPAPSNPPNLYLHIEYLRTTYSSSCSPSTLLHMYQSTHPKVQPTNALDPHPHPPPQLQLQLQQCFFYPSPLIFLLLLTPTLVKDTLSPSCGTPLNAACKPVCFNQFRDMQNCLCAEQYCKHTTVMDVRYRELCTLFPFPFFWF